MATNKHIPWWQRLLLITAWTVMAAVLAVVALLMCVTRLLQPEQLTPVAQRLANQYLDADVTIGRVALSSGGNHFLCLDVDSLTIISRPMLRLDAERRDSLPDYTDTLLTISHFDGGISLADLVLGNITLSDIAIDDLRANVYMAADVANFDIYRSEPSPEPEEPSTGLPQIAIAHFDLRTPAVIRYLDDSGNALTVNLNRTSLSGTDAPAYILNFDGLTAVEIPQLLRLQQSTLALDASVEWDLNDPLKFRLNPSTFVLDSIRAEAEATVDFANDLIINDYALKIAPVAVQYLVDFLPQDMRHDFGLDSRNFSTGIRTSLAVKSLASYNLTRDLVPHAQVDLHLDHGALRYGPVRLNRVGGDIAATLRGDTLDLTSVSVSNFLLKGPATDLTINVIADHLLSDPHFNGSVSGHAVLHRLPRALTDLSGGTVAGRLAAQFDFSGTQSMLAPNRFHLLRVDGDIDLADFSYVALDSTQSLYADLACLKFDTHNRINNTNVLKMSLAADSIRYEADSITATVTDLALGLGAANNGIPRDTAEFVPMGGRISMARLRLNLPGDSIRLNSRQLAGMVTLRRADGNRTLPQIDFNLEAERFNASTPTARLRLRQANLTLCARKNPPRQPSQKLQAIADSIATANPGLESDSVMALARAVRRQQRGTRATAQTTTDEVIDWGTDDSTRRFLRNWTITGGISAQRASVSTPAFPIKSRLRDFNLTFNNDSVVLHNVKYTAGSSDFTINGEVSNIRRSLTSRTGRQVLKVRFDVQSDTVDVNQLADAIFRGCAATAATIDPDNDDADFEVTTESDSIGPLLIPTNIDLRLNMRANNIRYADMLFHDFSGEVLAARGALHLNDLAASSADGDIALSALYSAPRRQDMQFGFGLMVNRFRIDRFLRLVPALDTIMPMMSGISGVIHSEIAATCAVDSAMNLELPSLAAAVSIGGDSLCLIDNETYRTIGKWLMFKDKTRNVIDHMDVLLTVADNRMQLYPFIFDIDRYRLGVQGYNDLAFNFDYHIAVLKSPLPFKFGINLRGNPDDYSIRVGKARLKEGQATSVAMADTTRVNLLREFRNVFRRGVEQSGMDRLDVHAGRPAAPPASEADTISHADSLYFIEQGLIEAPQPAETPKK